MNALTQIAVLTVLIITMCSIVAVVFLPDLPGENCPERTVEARRMIQVLDTATLMYYQDSGHFPIGTGHGSVELSRALRHAPRGVPYLEPERDMLNDRGDFRSPIAPETEVIHYRNNAVDWPANRYDASVGNKQAFDLWCRSCRGVERAINNWDDYGPVTGVTQP